jgi:hypothetical protein
MMNERHSDRQMPGMAPEEVNPVAGVWICPNCARRIQVITDGVLDKTQPFICACGATMEPGDDRRATNAEHDAARVVDG